MATPSSAASAALAHGRSFLGYKESPARSNRTRFGKQYGWDGVAWCAMFVWCILQDTGSSAGMVKSASTGAIERWGKSVGRFSRSPRTGDILILRNSKGATQHTELVYSWNGSRLLGLGGNTSGGAGSIADGGTVAINDRTALYKAGRITFVRPFYGVTTEAVKAVQKAAGITQDGKIGPATVAATKQLQAQHGLTVDGFPGPKTIAALTGAVIADVAAGAATEAAKTVKVAEDGRYGTATHSVVQARRGRPVDGRLGEGDLADLYWFFDLPVDDEISDQPRRAADIGNAIVPAIWDYDPDHQGNRSRLVRCLEAYVGVTVDRGAWGPDLSTGIQRFINTWPAGFTNADKGIALQRTAGIR